jgi:hypothetical protein
MKHATLKKLPVDVQAFEKMRGDNYVYVDKTRHIYKMISEGTYYFLSRPRRFGKSLLVSTLKCLFQGKKDLFEGLWIAEYAEWSWQEHPVVLLDFSDVANDSPEHLRQDLEATLHDIAGDYGFDLRGPLLQSKFRELIRTLARNTEMPVVVLIDEYDKPIIDHLGKGEEGLEIAKANRDLLKNFFGVLKSGRLAPILRCVFLTGISRFSKVSIFSQLNNLIDISMHDAYSDILGYTQEELEQCFRGHIEQLASHVGRSHNELLRQLALQYNGYRFAEKDARVYNPYSILKALAEQKLKNYWFETATPSFLIHFLKQERHLFLPQLEGIEVTRAIFATFELEHLFPEALLFQTGYLTITHVRNEIYSLDYPNQEVKNAFSEQLLLALTKWEERTLGSHVRQLAEYLRDENLEAFFETMTAIFASIPYTLNSQRDEAYFHTIFYLMLSASGVDADCEPLSSEGRIDLAVKFLDVVYLIEFKCNQSADAAIQQIQEKHYADRYRQQGMQITLIGINFDTQKRNLTEWKVVRE